jgi:hypothetical protein
MTRIRISRVGAVNCDGYIDVPLASVSVWGQIRDFQHYARQDFFHTNPRIIGDIPRAGATIALSHRYMGLRFERLGRILIWREGLGYSFSDLSRRGPRAGFPHVFSYRLELRGEQACRLRIQVRGFWTAHLVPRALAQLWLRWIFSHIVRTLGNNLLWYRLWRKSHGHVSN